jgi:hypothetical protein
MREEKKISTIKNKSKRRKIKKVSKKRETAK